MIKRLFLISAILLTLLTGGLLGTVLNSEWGLRLSINWLAAQLPGQLGIGHMQGCLLGPIELHDIEYQTGSDLLTIKQLSLHWRPSALLNGHVQLRLIEVTEVSYQIGEKPPSNADAEISLPEFSLPVPVDIEELNISGISIVQDTSKEAVTIDAFSLKAKAEKERINIGKLSLNMPAMEFQASGELLLSDDYSIQLDTNWQWFPAEQESAVAGNGTVSGSVRKLLLQQELTSPVYGNINITLIDLLQNWHYQFNGFFPGLSSAVLPAYEGPSFSGDIQLQGKGDLDVVYAAVEISGHHDSVGPVTATFDFHRDKQSFVISQLLLHLLDRDIKGDFSATLDNSTLDFNRAHLQAGDSTLDAKGSIGSDVRLQYQLDVAQLDDLLPEIKGRVLAKGSVFGPVQSPEVRLHLEGDKLAVRQYQAEKITADMFFDTQFKHAWSLSIDGQNVQFSYIPLDRLNIQSSGHPHKHTVSLEADSPMQKIAMSAEGSITEMRWLGRLTSLSVKDNNLGTWKSPRPVQMAVSASRWTLEKTCLQNKESSLCLQLNRLESGSTEGRMSLTQFPLALLQIYLTPAFSLHGQAEGELDFTMSPEGILQSQGKLMSSSGKIVFRDKIRDVIPVTFPFEKIDLQFSAAIPGDLTAKLDVRQSAEDTLSAELNMPGLTSLSADLLNREIRGKLYGRFSRFEIIEPLLPDTQNITGILTLDLLLDQTLANPKVTGQLALKNSALEIPRLGLQIQKINVQAKVNNLRNIQVSGRMESGDGHIDMDGALDLLHAPWQMHLKMQGTQFKVSHIPEARIEISPRLTLDLAPFQLDIQGEIEVPNARIEPRDISQAVNVSPDTVIVGQMPVESPQAWRVTSNIRLRIPDSVRFIGFGYDGRIGGDLVIIEEADRPTRARGELRAVGDSTYKVFGQKLRVNPGKLFFTDSPVDNPFLDITAAKSIDTIRVGIKASGTIRSPIITLFSEPAMDEADILAYLTLGHPLAKTQQNEGELLMQASNTAGLVGGNYLAGVIGRQFGLEETRLERSTTTQEPWLVVGTYLSPRLYLRYGIGLFDQGQKVLLRYQLLENWQLQGETGDNSGMDILFSHERP